VGSRWGPLFFMVGTMKRIDIVSEVERLLQPITRSLGLETVEVRIAGEGQRTVLRVLVDRPDGGITVEECAKVSEVLGRQLDLYDFIPHTYTLEVSSPGLDRPLRTDDEFRRFAGRRAEVVAAEPVDGQRRFRGMLLGVVGEAVVLQVEQRQVHIPKAQIHQARLVVEMDDLRADLER